MASFHPKVKAIISAAESVTKAETTSPTLNPAA